MSLGNGIAAVIAALALIAAVRANMIATRSAQASEQSAKEAARSADAAEDANVIAKEARMLALELSDVEWRLERSGDALNVRNAGSTTAYSVAALVRVDGSRFDVVAGDVGSDETFPCDAAHAFQAKRTENDRVVDSFAGSGIAYVPSYASNIEARVTWQSAQGTPHVAVVSLRA